MIKHLSADLLREIAKFLLGVELPVALTNKLMLRVARSIHNIHKEEMLSAQRLSAYLSSGSLTRFVVNHGMVELDTELMRIAGQEGCLESIQILRDQHPPCPWDEQTCTAAAKGGHLHVLQWARSQDPPCPWDEWTCRYAAGRGHLHVLQWARSQDPPCPWDGFYVPEEWDEALYPLG